MARLARWIFADGRALIQNIPQKARVGRGIAVVDGRPEDGHGGRLALQRAPVGRGINARRHAGDHADAALAQLKAQLFRQQQPVGRGLPLSHHGDGRQRVEIGELSPDI